MIRFTKYRRPLLTIAAAMAMLGYNSHGAGLVSGSLKLWYPVTITFEGPSATEVPATFANYRLDVTFTKGAKVFKVPGYFAADGDAANSSAAAGNKWRVKFTPDETGEWDYTVSFLTGTNIAGTAVAVGGTPVAPNGETGKFIVLPKDPVQPGFYNKGILQYVGEHYLQFAGSKEWFIKGGAGSPENLTGYFEFDGTSDKGGTAPNVKSASGLHEYPKHVADWKTGDPTWKGGKGKGIIGRSNYLASTGSNAQYIIPANSTGDGYDSWPWTDALEYGAYDVSKLDQWEIVFAHMDAVGINKDYYFYESETTNDIKPGPVRNIHYREIIARFSHLLAIRWNISEEPSIPFTQSGPEMEFLASIEPYKHPVGIHTHAGNAATGEWAKFLNNKAMVWASGQIHTNLYNVTLENVKASAAAAAAGTGNKWIVDVDESQAQTTGATDKPKTEFWENVMAGGEGYDVYFGYGNGVGDCDDEDMRARDYTWKHMGLGVKFWMSPYVNRNIGRDGGFVATNAPIRTLANTKIANDATYIVHAGTASPGSLDMSKASGEYDVWWYEIKTGGNFLKGSVSKVTGGGSVSLGAAPAAGEWVVFVGKTDGVAIKQVMSSKNSNALNVTSMADNKLLVTYKLSSSATVTMELYNSQGILTKTLTHQEVKGIGEHATVLKGSEIPKGINFLRLLVSDSHGKTVYSRPLPKGI